MTIFGHPLSDYVDSNNPKADMMGLCMISSVWSGLFMGWVGFFVLVFTGNVQYIPSLTGLVASMITGPALGHSIQYKGTYGGEKDKKSEPINMGSA